MITPATPPEFVVDLADLTLDDLARVGGKTASLGELIRELGAAGVRVPPGYAVTASAYQAVLAQGSTLADLRAVLADLDIEDLDALARAGRAARARVVAAGLPSAVADAIRSSYRALRERVGGHLSVAVRSSATAEDLPEASFAGQQASFLAVQDEHGVVSATLRCFASLFTDRAIAYRVAHGFDHFAVLGAVAVQQMVRADLGSAGVIFTLDPESGNRNVVLVTGAWGLGENVVAGRVDPDEFVLFKPALAELGDGDTAREPLIRRRLGAKQSRVVVSARAGETTRTVLVSPADRRRYCLEPEDLRTLGRWALAIEDHYGRRKQTQDGEPLPMDIEWAKDGLTGELFIVQARPETVHARDHALDLVRTSLDTRALAAAPELLLHGAAIGSRVGTGKVRVIRELSAIAEFQAGEILVADMTDPDWVPALRKAAAIVTNRGGRTCHAAIVSRELGVPCVVGTGDGTERLIDGQEVTVSCAHGSEGRVYAGAIPLTHERIAARGESPRAASLGPSAQGGVAETSSTPGTAAFRLLAPDGKPGATRHDGVHHEPLFLDEVGQLRTKLMLILADPDQALTHARLPVAGVGLVRQEFVIANHIGVHPLAVLDPGCLDEAERAELDARVRDTASAGPVGLFVDQLAEGVATIAAGFWPRPVIVRLGDFKSNEYAGLLGGRHFEPSEDNPMIGLRGASRYVHPKFAPAFELECRALRRVCVDMGLSNVALMVPFCRTPAEGREVIAALAGHGLVQGHGPGQVAVWVMCELPANVLAVDRFAEVFDGFSIGSNDLTQLILGVDRDSAELGHLFSESDEAVLRAIRAAIAGAHAAGLPIGLCGQAPSDDPSFAGFLVAEGIDSISVSPDAVFEALKVVAAAEAERGAD